MFLLFLWWKVVLLCLILDVLFMYMVGFVWKIGLGIGILDLRIES